MKSFVAPLLAASAFALKIKQTSPTYADVVTVPTISDDIWNDAITYSSVYNSADISTQDFTYGTNN